ncbi:porin [Photobacterium swingsii]|uniref:Porin n=1 Tax=Photobacterium swingsii TaxID=680026 RepID=A0A0J8VAQ4_9GAMM|nr:porin [Photobacterium swingsii]KMV29660.1 membrane protein [Photobacterium swingsii]PSW26526.1 porin [Photobacterium swingsii]
MKKTILAALLPAMLVAGTAQAATIYQGEDGSNVDVFGRLGFNVTNRDNNEDTSKTIGQFDGRLGLGGSQTINDQMSVIGWAEYQVNAAEGKNGNKDLTARYVWAGVDMGSMGKVTAGRVASGLIMATDIADVFALSDVTLARQAGIVNGNATQVFRQDDTLQYQNSFGDFDLSAAYILGNEHMKSGYNVAGRYTLDMGNAGKLAPVVAYQQNNAEDNRTDNADKYDFWAVGTRYYIGDLMLGAVYSQDKVSYTNNTDASEDKGYELTAVYDFQNDWVVRGGYRNVENTGGDNAEYKDLTAEVQYKLTDRSSLFTSYVNRNGQNGENGQNTNIWGDWNNAKEDYYHVGLRYEF